MGSWRSLLLGATSALLVTAAPASADIRRAPCDGAWEDLWAWTPPGLPNLTSDVVVDCPNGTVTLATRTSIGSLAIVHGTLDVSAPGETVSIAGPVSVQGLLRIDRGRVRIDGEASMSSPVLMGGGGATLTLEGLTRMVGTIRVPSGGSGSVSGLMTVGQSGELQSLVADAEVPIEGRLAVAGRTGATLRVTDGLSVTGGTVTSPRVTGRVVVSSGTYAAAQTIGDVQVDDGGVLAVAGTRITGALSIGLSGIVRASLPADGSPALVVSESATLGGRLEVIPPGAFRPEGHAVLTAGSILRQFVPGWPVATYGPTTVAVSFAPSLRAPTVPAMSTSAPRAGVPMTAGSGTWDGAPTVTRRWVRCRTACVPIAGATGVRYVPTRADVGARLGVRVRAENGAGSTTAESERFVVLPALPLTAQKKPSVTGTATVGTRLRCLPGRWTGSAKKQFTFAWLRDGKPSGGTRKPTLLLGPADAGRRIACRVSVLDTLYGGKGRATTAARRVRA